MTLTLNTVLGVDTFERPDESPLEPPYTTWTSGSGRPDLQGGSAVLNGIHSDTTRPEKIGPDCFTQIDLDFPMAADGLTSFYTGARLTTHSIIAGGYTAWLEPGATGWQVTIRRGAALTAIKTSATDYGTVTGLRLQCVGPAITAHVNLAGQWTEAAAATDSTYPAAGYTGFGIESTSSPVGIEAFTWGNADQRELAGRMLQRLAPIAGGALNAVAAALTGPGEIFHLLARDSDTHTAWGKALDPDQAPSPLLRWLALFPGVTLQPGDTEAQQRYRIRQAAGLYKSTPRAVIEELQLILTGTKTVLIGWHTPDQWQYLVGTFSIETPDLDAAGRAVEAQEPAGMIATHIMVTTDPTWFTLAPNLLAHRETVDGQDTYVIDDPEYPTWQSVIDHFSTWQHLVDNNPDL